MQLWIFAQVKKAKKQIRVGFCMRLCVSVCNSLGVSHVNQPPAAQLPFTLLFICCCWGLGRLIRVHHSLSPSPFLSIFLSLVLAHCKQTDTQTLGVSFSVISHIHPLQVFSESEEHNAVWSKTCSLLIFASLCSLYSCLICHAICLICVQWVCIGLTRSCLFFTC